MRAAYAIAYRLGLRTWDHPGMAAEQAFRTLLDREEADREPPFGRALDLGCGLGAHTRELQDRGWQATGIDNLRRVLDAAMHKSGENERYVLGDVAHLEGSGVGKNFAFYLDVGCFHGLRDSARIDMGRGVTALARPDATLLMLCFRPQRNPLVPRGADLDDVRRAFPEWKVLDVRDADPTALPDAWHRYSPQWFRLGLG